MRVEWLVGGTLVLAVVAGREAGAQPASPAAPPADAGPAITDEELQRLAEEAAAAEQPADAEVITVTGSLVERREVATPSPIAVYGRARLLAAGLTGVGDILQRSPAQGNALNAQYNNGGDGSVRLDLRSLGVSRTLVLLDGRRVVPSGLGADGAADLGTIPLAMIERVEVLKDGASALYGSDAIAGVVNMITRTDVNGTETALYTGTSQRGDGSNFDVSFVTGQGTKASHVTFAAGYQRQYPVMAGDRDFSARSYVYDFASGTATLEGSTATPNGRLDASGLAPGTVPGCSSLLCTNDPATGWRDYVEPTPTSFGDSYNTQPLNYVYTPSQRVNLFANGYHRLGKRTRAFFQASFNRRDSALQVAETRLLLGQTASVISADSVYNPFGVEITDFSRRMTEFGPRVFEQAISTTRIVIGVDGKLAEDRGPLANWKWEISYNHGRSDALETQNGELVLDRLEAALGPSFIAPDGTPTCGTPSAPITGCVPLDVLTPGNASRAARDYLAFTGTASGFNSQHTVLATASGQLVKLPRGGDLSAAVGGDYRYERGGYTPDPLTGSGNTTGNTYQPTRGSYDLFEGFAQLSLVPVTDLDLAKWTQLDAVARAYRYNTFGSGLTYKLGGLWTTKYGVGARGTYGTAFRAPNVAELYLGNEDSFERLEDPCDTTPPSEGGNTITLDPRVAAQCTREGVPPDAAFGTSQQRVVYGGNPNLDAETATIATGGVIAEPLADLALTLDYWRIRIENAIGALPPQVLLANCYLHGIGCERVVRSASTSEIVQLLDVNANAGATTTSGIDLGASYRHATRCAGEFRYALEGTYLLAYDIETGVLDDVGRPQVIHGRSVYDLGVRPRLKLNAFATWSHGSGLGAAANARFIGGFDECDGNDCSDPANARRDVPAYIAGDALVSYTTKTTAGASQITLGVNNVADARPPRIYNGAVLNADESAYDFLGRYVYLRLGQVF